MHTDRDGYARAGEAMLATGTTAYQPTFITAPEADLVAALREIPLDAADGGPTRDRRARRGPVHLAAADRRAPAVARSARPTRRCWTASSTPARCAR